MLTPAQIIDGIQARFGRHPKARALHAKGVFCSGRFTATAEASRLSRAAHLQGTPVDVMARFSNGSGDPHAPDHDEDVRGLGVSFALPDGARTDIVAQTSPRFPVRTPEAFLALVQAAKPGLGQLYRLPAFLLTHPSALPALGASGASRVPPRSYLSVPYYAIHAYKWVAADGNERFVRYRWLPDTEARLSRSEARALGANYLQTDLAERLAKSARLTLHVQVAEAGDVVDDPMSVWPETRHSFVAGTLELTKLVPEAERDGSVWVFDPTRITDGIALSADPILLHRAKSYSVSVERRLAASE